MDGTHAVNNKTFRFIKYSELDDHRDDVIQLAHNAWPEYMWHDAVAKEFWHELFDRFPEFQPVLLDSDNNHVAAIGHSLPFHWSSDLDNLPDKGWDWVIYEGVANHKNDIEPNTLAAIMVAISPEYQRQGLSTRVLKELSKLGRSKGFKDLVVPVRPNQKSQYPLTSMEDYIHWKKDNGLPFDAWLRVHVRLGGKIIKVCHEAKTIHGTRTEWEKWTGMKYLQSGQYIVPGALNPIKVDVENDEGVYIEPNVWVHHSLA